MATHGAVLEDRALLGYRPEAAVQLGRTAPAARRLHSSRAIVPTGREPAMAMATIHKSGSKPVGTPADDRIRPQDRVL